jgi:hypothetical protein
VDVMPVAGGNVSRINADGFHGNDELKNPLDFWRPTGIRDLGPIFYRPC